MSQLPDYASFLGYHPVTGSVANVLDYSGVGAPHREGPLSEAVLAGVAGGIALGYFYFKYEGRPPQVNIVTRNSFNGYGFDSLRSRLGISVDVLQTTSAEKGRDNLIRTLESNDAPMVRLDTLGFSYESNDLGDDMWMVNPVVVHSYDDHEVGIADRADTQVVVSRDAFDAARAKIKKERFYLATLDLPDLSPLPEAVRAGIADCVALYFEKPPRGSAQNWGKKALAQWQKLLRGSAKTSWKGLFGSPEDRYAALSTAYKYAFLFWKDRSETADRGLYAEFLREAADILGDSAFNDVAAQFDQAADRWKAVASAILPDWVPALAKTRELLYRRHVAFLDSGSGSIEELQQIDKELGTIAADEDALAVSEDDERRLYDEIADSLADVEAVEPEAFSALKEAATQ